MLNKNHIILGIVLGLIIPFVGYALILELFDQMHNAGVSDRWGDRISFKPRTLGLLALCLNLIPFSIYNKRKFTNTMRGLMLATVCYGVAWVVTYGKSIIENS